MSGPGRVVVILWIIALMAPAYFLAANVIHGPVNSESLQESFSSAADDTNTVTTGCNGGGSGVWNCGMSREPGASGPSDEFRVATNDGSCWDATHAKQIYSSSYRVPTHASGCAVQSDNWDLDAWVTRVAGGIFLWTIAAIATVALMILNLRHKRSAASEKPAS